MEDLRVVFESRNRQSCSDRSLVLAAASIPHQVIDDGTSCVLVVDAEHSARAAEELRLYDHENPPVRPKPARRIQYQDSLPGIIGYVFVVCIVAGMAGYSVFGSNWFAAGRVDGELIRDGEWWRTITALTLHSGLRHLVGNIVFGVFFGLFAGRLLGSGVAGLAIVCAYPSSLKPSFETAGASVAEAFSSSSPPTNWATHDSDSPYPGAR